MTTFEGRKQAHEANFALDEKLRFKATARRNKLLGLWAAELMGITGDDAEAYAMDVVKSDFEAPGEEDVFRKIREDLDAKSVERSDHQIVKQMEDLMKVAIEQINEES